MCNLVDLSFNKLHPKVDKKRAEQEGREEMIQPKQNKL